MNRFFLTLILLALLTACAPTQAPLPNLPVDSDDSPNGLPPIYAPRPGDDTLLRGNVYLDSTDLLAMESFPVQFSLLVKGNLPTPCHELRAVYYEPDADNKIKLEIYSVAKLDAVCVQMLQPFEQGIYLGSFPSGHYTVWVNEEKVAEFDS